MDLRISVNGAHDEGREIYANDNLLWREGGCLTCYETVPLKLKQIALFRGSENTTAVHCHQTVGGQFIDMGISRLR